MSGRVCRWVAGWGLAALAAVPGAARGQDGAKVTTENDVTYVKRGETELKVDIARPGEGDGPFPVVFVIHGGGWQGGDKKAMRPALQEFARRGYVAVSPQYRFAPKHPFPAQVHDVKTAVRWVKAHAKHYKADPDHVGAVGFSAGGHLSLMLGLTGPDDGLEGEPDKGSADTRVHAVVNYFGPTDLAASDIPDVTKPILEKFIGDSAETAKKASPLTYVSKGDAPTLTFQGTKDPLVPHTQATKLADAMTAAGVPGRVELLIGAGHGWGGNDLKLTMAETLEFFDAHLKPKAK